VVPTGNVEPDARLVVTVGVEQLSVAVGAGKFTAIDVAELLAGSETTIFVGQLSVGAVVSFTVNVVEAVVLLPTASVATMVMVCVPSVTIVPAVGLCVIVIPAPELQLSVTVVPETTFGMPDWQLPLAEATVAAGAVTTGAVLSITVIVCVALELFPATSVAVNVRVIISGLAAEPTPPLLVSEAVTVGGAQLSEAVAWEPLAAGTALAHSYVAFAGAVIVGASPSATVIV